MSSTRRVRRSTSRAAGRAAAGAEAPRIRVRTAARQGFTLVALVVVVAVMNVLVAAALPSWSQMMKRDREAELIFRGLQYAEAIRVFQLRFGRYPNTLDELIEVNPRSIRRLWKDPMTDDGEWDLIRSQSAPRGQRQGRQGSDVAAGSAPGGDAREEQGRRRRATGPIIGVRSRSEEEALRSFLGASRYADWQFTAELIPAAVVVPGTLNVPRPTSDWVGRPFREDLKPREGGLPGEGSREETPQGRPSQRRRPQGP